MAALVLGSSSTIGSWIQEALSLLKIETISISRSDHSDYKITDYSSYPQLFAAISNIYHSIRIDSIYVCPGVYTLNSLSKLTPDQWSYDLFINLTLPFYVYHILAHLSASSSSFMKLVFLGSTASISKPLELPAYSIGKYGLEALSTYINNETSTYIRSTCLRLGTANTSFSLQNESKSHISKPDIINCIEMIELSRPEVLPDLISMRPIHN